MQLAGQIARALAVFCVDEIVVFDDGQNKQWKSSDGSQLNGERKESYTGNTDPGHFLMHILSYLETPPYLRQRLFPMHPNLQKAGALPSLDMPHHLRPHEWCQYREGITTEEPSKAGDGSGTSVEPRRKKKNGATKALPELSMTPVDVGFTHPVTVPSLIPPNSRVTIKLPDTFEGADEDILQLAAEAVAPTTPREQAGYYWGYTVRSAYSLSTVLTESPFDGGYDLTLGTSERGKPVSNLSTPSQDEAPIPEFRHMLIVFGGVAGLEAAVKADDELQKMGVKEPSELFDYWVNLCLGQGSRTVRTEEAVWIGLTALRDIVVKKGTKRPSGKKKEERHKL